MRRIDRVIDRVTLDILGWVAVERHSRERLASFVDRVTGKRITYAQVTA
jgi:hypothetical protein